MTTTKSSTSTNARRPRTGAAASTQRRRLAARDQAGAEGAPTPPAPSATARPSQSTSNRDDATTVRAILRAILSTLDGTTLAALVAALVTWCFELHNAASIVDATRPVRGTPRDVEAHALARSIAENADHRLAQITRGSLRFHERAVFALIFGHSPAWIARNAHEVGLGFAEVPEALEHLRSTLEAMATSEAAPIAADLLAVALHQSTEHAARVAALEALLCALNVEAER